MLIQDSLQALLQIFPFFLQLRINSRAGELSESGQTGSDGQRIAGERPGLIHGTFRCQQIHDLPPSPKGPQRQPSAQYLSQTSNIREYPVEFLRSPWGETKTADPLVEDQKRSMPGRRLPQGRQKLC